MFPKGVGVLHIRFEELKQKLAAEGLFDAARKKPLPFLPRKIGIITSPTGAAVRDCISVIRRRFPVMDLLIIPAIVQGEDGPPSVVAALKKAEDLDLDLVILARGGGSIEELWTFNDESVARAIDDCPLPVISGVGHETDFTIADFVADRRAPTPSAAAEMAVPDYYQLCDLVNQYEYRLRSAVVRLAAQKRQTLAYLTERRVFLRPKDRVNQEQQRIDELLSKLSTLTTHQVTLTKQYLQTLSAKLESLSPLAVLARGYAVCQKTNAQIITDPDQVTKGEQIIVRVQTGQLWCEVEKGEKYQNG